LFIGEVTSQHLHLVTVHYAGCSFHFHGDSYYSEDMLFHRRDFLISFVSVKSFSPHKYLFILLSLQEVYISSDSISILLQL